SGRADVPRLARAGRLPREGLANARRPQDRRRHGSRYARGASAPPRDTAPPGDPGDRLRVDGPRPLGPRDPPRPHQAGLPQEDAADESDLALRPAHRALRNAPTGTEDRAR